MIGSPLTATFTLEGLPINLTTDSFTWAVSGGAPFADYDPSLLANQYKGYNPPTGFGKMSTSFCFAQETRRNGASISCLANLSSLGLTISSRSFALPIPPRFSDQALALGQFLLLKKDLINGIMKWVVTFTDPTHYKFVNAGFPDGAFLNQTCSTPSPFIAANDKGSFSFVQLAKASVTVITSPPFPPFPDDDLWGLDGSYPYPVIGGPFPADNEPMQWFDSPGITGVNLTTGGSYSGAFELYVMYKPPGQGKWVPLRVLPWSCGGSYAVNPNSNPPFTALNVPTVRGTTRSYPPHPTWSRVIGSCAPTEN